MLLSVIGHSELCEHILMELYILVNIEIELRMAQQLTFKRIQGKIISKRLLAGCG